MGNHTKMSAKCRASGGRVAYTGSGSNVVKEAKSDANMKGGGKVPGGKGKHRVKKARGGGVGSDQHPFSSAHRG